MPDPKLKLAAAEIQAVLQKYDIAALVTLQSQTHAEYIHEITPSWSCARFETLGGKLGLRVRAKRTDFPSAEAHKKCLTETIGMIMCFADSAKNSHKQMLAVAKMLGTQIDFSHISRLEK